MRYCVLKNDRFRRTNENLVYAAPYLINDFLRTCPHNIDILNEYLDGALSEESKRDLRREFEPKARSFFVDNFTKKKKVHHCPFVIYASHVISNAIFNQYSQFICPDKMVAVPE